MFHGLPQLVECNEAAIEKGPSIDCRLDTSLAAIKEARANGALQVGDRLCDDRI